MNVLIISTAPEAKDNSSSVHIRNAKVICKANSYDFASRAEDLKKKNYDVILFSYASFYFDFEPFMKFLDTQKQARIGWITNEYNLSPNSCFKNRIEFVISNFKYDIEKNLMVNLNTLIFDYTNLEIQKKYDICYYGTFRPNREKYFVKYLQRGFHLSTSAKNFKKYKQIGCNPTYISKFTFEDRKETLNLYKKTLYIEDVETHTQYNHLANRFYEALKCNVLPVFDRSCENTIKQSKYYIPEELIIDCIEDTKKQFSNAFKSEFIKRNSDLAIQDKTNVLTRIDKYLKDLI